MSIPSILRETAPAKVAPRGTIRPLLDFVLLAPHKLPPDPAKQILMPDTVETAFNTSRVVAVGPGKWDHGQFVEPQFKVGDIVVAVGNSLDMGDGCVLLQAYCIVAVIEPASNGQAS